jgi:predicted dehydrogenase
MMVFDDLADEKLVFYDKRAEAGPAGWTLHRGESSPEPIDSGEPLSRMANAFLAAVRTGTPPRADGSDGLRVVRVLDAAQRSMDAGGRPVALEVSR